MADAALESALAAGSCDVGQVRIRRDGGDGYVICHRDDATRTDLRVYEDAAAAIDFARSDDQGNYRPLKTAPNLCHDWSLHLASLDEVQRALEAFYPGRLAMLAAFDEERLAETSLRQTLNRQTGMYRVAANVSDEQIDNVVAETCRSDGGCLRTILWRKNQAGASPSKHLPREKFDHRINQVDGGSRNFLPLLCPEACAILIDACRVAVKSERPNE
jgi:sirohydrochlorin cobaltochelatase